MWTDAWVGLRYKELGRGPDLYDCLGFYLAVYEARTGIMLPDPMISRLGSARSRSIGRALGHYVPVEVVAEGDALLFQMAGGSMHVGYALNGRDMLHLEADAACSCIENWRSSRWLGRHQGIYRYAG